MPPTLTLGHSPDPDDAFMWWPLLEIDGRPPCVGSGRFRFEAVAEDIETLNRRAEAGDLDITAISCAQYARVGGRYAITSCGASMGDGYGPKIVARRPMAVETLADPSMTLAVPGERTSAMAAARLRLAPRAFRHEVVPFDEIIDRVADGAFDAGLVIHEGQLTFEDAGLVLVEDLGAWWTRRTGLPLPLGLNVVRRDLDEIHGPGALAEIARLQRDSVLYALEHRDEALRHARVHARGLDDATAGVFVDLYVNTWTLDFGPRGREGVAVFLRAAAAAGALPAVERIVFATPEGVEELVPGSG